ncbi:NAD(P)-dependent dehydrogenase (short-subunit alcohol dehydrogenase family) [Sphingobium wenxiniae]|uniref:Ketoreductase domain-containing protein n=2 Tax=Sphingobium TaxID=165695 RepID=T0HB47_9SPHN|nr:MULTISPECIES: glucose 1-dehydrogenase [Sphingobium]EQA96604.1 hypothetical protein L485_24015 [Sphingobium baderi LL03]KMS64333.1 short-chain dehydrogenase [Sphingobium baderi LL03]MBB6190450.1 NAD(P)-dependent dehydrogenase (short-subunit alcohol dehydrogenase family) [Sphingobium wenxiniae]TWH95167.1 NAD(P)-dependent dehydrogenase (short-subunit alcohol dehydrogenase family) [Sphingobium wenxiniae]
MTAGARLRGRRIIITGAASGIGRATARLFSQEGAALALVDLQKDSLEEIAAQTGGQALTVDLSDHEATRAVVAQAAQLLGGLDGVVNCAGISGSCPLADLDQAAWDRMMAINLTAPYVVCRAALPFLQEAAAATIVNVASGQALLPTAHGISAYSASKAGLAAFTKALAFELAPRIRANVIAPGIVQTPMVESVLGGYSNPDEAPFVAQYALKRVARPSELADAILFLTSGESSFVTGALLAVDGGRTFH